MSATVVSDDPGQRSVDDLCTLRPARAQDAGILAELDAGNPSPWSLRRFTEVIGRPGEGVLVVQYRNDIVGFAVYSALIDEATLLNITVVAHWRGQGLGRRLLGGVLERMRSNGAARCLLEVRQSNAVARRLYESAGFEVDGERRNYYPGAGAREHALLMSRSL